MSNNNNNSGTNYFNDLNNSDLLFINILNSMYNDNLRIVHHLIDQNTQIRNTIINIMNNRRTPNISNNTNRNNLNRNRANNVNDNVNTNQPRLYIIDNLPYYLDNSQMTAMSFNNNFEQLNSSRNYLNRNRNTNSVDITSHLARILNSFLDPDNERIEKLPLS
jgi:ribosome-binding factor A